MWLGICIIIVAFWFFRSPLAAASAEAIRRNSGADDPRLEKEVARLAEEVSAVRQELAELGERVDFAERALADVRRRDLLQPPRS